LLAIASPISNFGYLNNLPKEGWPELPKLHIKKFFYVKVYT